VESGTMTTGCSVLVSPTKKMAKVESIYIGETKVLSAKPGENVQLRLGLNIEDFQKGYVLCNPDNVTPTVKGVKCLVSLVDMLEHRPLLSPGYDCVLHVHTVEIEVTVSHLLCVIEAGGKKVKRPYARQGQLCQLALKFSSGLSTCVEKFEDFPALGRITLRDEGKTIAIGKVLECLGKSG
jgi:peptide chain release factor subunit 3